MTATIPRFSDLTADECEELLARHHSGRLAFTFHDRVDIEPITYVLEGDWIYGRTAPGTKLRMLSHHPWVAFEVDEIEGPFDWRSVVARGTVYFLTRHHFDTITFDRAVMLLRTIDPRILTDEDLVPERTTLFRIHIDRLTGRRAEMR